MNVCEYVKENKNIILSEEQLEAVNNDSNKLLLLAVPGAGKTTVLTIRLARLIAEKNINPSEMLVITFNRAAAIDMRKRWETLFIDTGINPPHFSTIHSFCYTLLKIYAKMRGTRAFDVLDNNPKFNTNMLMRSIYQQYSREYLTDDDVNNIYTQIGYAINMLIPSDELNEVYKLNGVRFDDIFRDYKQFKRENGVMDFDDMLMFTYIALQKYPPILSYAQNKYKYIFVDEVQDTSKLQQNIIRLITTDNLFMVGDEDQSIYGFRGAFPQGLLEFFNNYPDGKILKMQQNYRSSLDIINSANSLIKHNVNRYDKTIFTTRQKERAVELITDEKLEDEYSNIASLCNKNIKNGESTAVLYRTVISAIGLANEFKHKGIPFTISKTMTSYSNDFIVRDIMNILRLCKNPEDIEAFNRVYFKMDLWINKQDAQLIKSEYYGDIFLWISQNDNFSRQSVNAYDIYKTLKTMRRQKPHIQVLSIVNVLNYYDNLVKKAPGGYMASSYMHRLNTIYNIARYCEDTDELLEKLGNTDWLFTNTENTDVPCVRLSTVHSAKGQEYDDVIIADAYEGVFPDVDSIEYNSFNSTDGIEEELRLFYTAVTRAKNKLWIFAPESWQGNDLLISRFIDFMNIDGSEKAKTTYGVRVGMGISHVFFGAGVITEINEKRKLVTIEFRHNGTRMFTAEKLQDKELFKTLS